MRYLQSAHSLSQRQACRLAKLSRKTAAYQAVPRDDTFLKTRLNTLGEQYPRYGYLMLLAMLKIEGIVVNRKRTKVLKGSVTIERSSQLSPTAFGPVALLSE